MSKRVRAATACDRTVLVPNAMYDVVGWMQVTSPKAGSSTTALKRQTSGKQSEAAPTGTAVGGEGQLLASVPANAKWKSWWERFWTTWSMIFGFFGLIYVGHPALVVFVFALQTMMFREIYRLGLKASTELELPYFKFLPWYVRDVRSDV